MIFYAMLYHVILCYVVSTQALAEDGIEQQGQNGAYLLALEQMLVVLHPPWELSTTPHLGIENLREKEEEEEE